MYSPISGLNHVAIWKNFGYIRTALNNSNRSDFGHEVLHAFLVLAFGVFVDVMWIGVRL